MSPNVAIFSATIAVVSLVLTIFGASWLNQRATERLLEQMENRFEAKLDVVLVEIKRLDHRIDSVDHRIDSLEQRFERLERQLDALFRPGFPPRA
jgi:peptidoglycan hydrolase CwlO-like protein